MGPEHPARRPEGPALSPEEARYAALRTFGGVTRVKEDTWEVWGMSWLEQLWQDVRFGLRVLAKNPGFTAVAVLTLALGISAASAIFTVVESVILRPLPYPEPRRLFLIQSVHSQRGAGSLSAAEYVEYQKQTQAFDRLAAYSAGLGSNLTGTGEPMVVRRCEVTAAFWPTMGIAPELGRTFDSKREDEAANLVIISDRLWRSHFAANPRVSGTVIFLDEAPYTIVGVMPAGFDFPHDPDVWTAADLRVLDSSKLARPEVIGRLKASSNTIQAQAELDVFKQRFQAAHPEFDPKVALRLYPLYKYIVGDVQGALLLLLGAAGVVLLVSCVNVANLLLARGFARLSEVAVRTSLGAGRARLLRQFLTEGVLLSLLGGILGLLFARWLVRVFLWIVPSAELPRFHEIHLDGWVLAAASAASLLTGLLFGLLPALHLSGTHLTDSLRTAGKPWAWGGGNRLRSTLVVSEIASALVLLIGAGLMLKSFARLRSVNPGFNPHNLLTMTVVLSQQRTLPQIKSLVTQTIDNMANLPGASAVAAVSWLPFGHADVMSSFVAEGHVGPGSEQMVALRVAASSGYFRGMGIRLLRGREFTPADGETSARVVILGETLARRVWPDQDAVGKRMSFDWRPGPNEWYTVAGVVEDIKQRWLGEPPPLTVYQPYAQVDKPLWLSQVVFIVRTPRSPGLIFPLMKAQLYKVDKDQPVYALEPMETLISGSMAATRYESSLLAAFGALAMLIAAVGVYGVVAFSVSQRLHEIGIRMALGAQRGEILQNVLRRCAALGLLGIAVGVCGGLAVSGLLRSYLFQVRTTDFSTLALSSLLLVAVTMLSSYIPARRATKVDPIVTLRHE